MRNIESHISPLIENLFPAFYKEEGPNFIAFVKAYYEWLETMLQTITVEDPEDFSVGDIILQTLDDGATVRGQILYKIDDNFVVLPETLEVFRCIELCGVIHPIIKESDGTQTYIIRTVNSSPIFQGRNLLKYRDIDQTVDRFIILFKEKYLKNIQFDIASNKKLLIKNSLDLYRSKGTSRSFDLFFKLVYGIESEVYYPGDDIFRPSDGVWHKPHYIEISSSIRAVDFVGKQIYGVNSEASAFVEKYIKRRVNNDYRGVLFISNISGEFEPGELLKTDELFLDSPKVIGSMRSLEVISGGSSYSIGDIVSLEGSGIDGAARVANVAFQSGQVSFDLKDGGFGYTANSIPIVSDNILTLSNPEPADILKYLTINSGGTGYSNGDVVTVTTQTDYAEAIIGTGSIGEIADFTIDIQGSGFGDSNVSLTFANSTGGSSLGTGANLEVISQKNQVYYDFGESVTQTVGYYIFTNANNDFSYGEQLYQYNANNEVIGKALVFQVSQETGANSGSIGVNFYFGQFGDGNTIYSESNTKSHIVGTITVDSSSGKIIPTIQTGTITINISNSSFSGIDSIYQLDEENWREIANAEVAALSTLGSTEILEVENVQGAFVIGRPVLARGSSISANLISTNFMFGVYDTSGTFVTNTFVQSETNHTIANLISISTGTDASFEIGALENVESFQINSDLLGANNVSWVAANTDVMTPEPYMDIPLNNFAYGFPSNPQGNLSSIINSCLSFENIDIGTIQNLQRINPGANYNSIPEIVVYEPRIVPYEYRDYLLVLSNTSSEFQEGEGIIQESIDDIFYTIEIDDSTNYIMGEYIVQGNSAIGILESKTSTLLEIKLLDGTFSPLANVSGVSSGETDSILSFSSNSTPYITTGIYRSGNVDSIVVKRISIENEFVVGKEIFGQFSGATAIIDEIIPYEQTPFVGLNAEVEGSVIDANGSVVELEVVDSGFGYLEGDVVSYSHANGSFGGTASVSMGGIGSSVGYYRETKGFLSSNKYIHDGDYYQEYSYDIISKLPLDRYSDMFKNVMHVAGTKMFGSVLLSNEPDMAEKAGESRISISEVENIEGIDVRFTTEGDIRETNDEDRRIGEL